MFFDKMLRLRKLVGWGKRLAYLKLLCVYFLFFLWLRLVLCLLSVLRMVVV